MYSNLITWEIFIEHFLKKPPMNIKTATEKYFNDKHIEDWRLIDNGILEYGQFMFELGVSLAEKKTAR